MENNLIIKIAVCPDCKGYKAATPQKGYDKKPALFQQAKDLKEEMGDCLSLNTQEYENIRKSGNLSEVEVSAFDFENEYWIYYCGCTPICSKIRTFKDACNKLDISDSIPNFTGLPTPFGLQMLAFYQLSIITKALNEGWDPTCENSEKQINEVSYPKFFFNSLSEFPYKNSCVPVDTERAENEYNEREPGFLLVFKNEGLAKYAGTQFRELYLDLYQYPESYLNRYIKQ